jgi:tetratricopeptide (TPR) repeat protein
MFLCGFAAAPALFADSRIARLYFEEGRNFQAAGARAEALELLETALRFRPEYSDALFLKSKILAEKPENRREASELARAAIKAASWEAYDLWEGTLHLCGLLAQLRRYREVLFLLNGSKRPGPRSVKEYELLLRCHQGLDDKKNLNTVLQAALEAFPEELFFLETYFRVSDPLRPETVRHFELVKRYAQWYLPAIAAYILRAGDSDGVLKLAWDYFHAGGEDPAVSCLLIEKGLVDPAREMERFTAFGGLSRMDLLRKIASALRVQHPRLLADALAAFSGQVVFDRDRDGIPEENFFIKEGKPSLWKIDEDQDGLDEIAIEFSENGLPSQVGYLTHTSTMTLNYAEYPYIGESLYHDESRDMKESRTLRARVLPGNLAVPIVLGIPPAASVGVPWLDYRLNRSLASFSRERVENSAYMYEERNSLEPEYVQEVFLENGKVQQIDIKYMEKTPNVIVHRLLFEKGRFSYGLRDIDRDGNFDLREFFEDGKLMRLSLDTTGDGKEDYTESFFPDIVKEWDIDGDGVVDAREARGGDGLTRRSYPIPFGRYYGGAE